MNEYSNIEDLLNKNDDELFELIGRKINKKYILPPSTKKLIENGKKWFKDNKLEIVNIICTNKKIKDLMSKKINKIELIAAIADLISSVAHGIPAFVVSILLFKQGIDSLCSSHKEYNKS